MVARLADAVAVTRVAKKAAHAARLAMAMVYVQVALLALRAFLANLTDATL
jgi:hypothetical protein